MKNLEWSGRAKPYRDPMKAAPHPHSPVVIDEHVCRRVTEDLTRFFAEGWIFFDSYARAVTLCTRPERRGWRPTGRVLVDGCAVKLQRHNGDD